MTANDKTDMNFLKEEQTYTINQVVYWSLRLCMHRRTFCGKDRRSFLALPFGQKLGTGHTRLGFGIFVLPGFQLPFFCQMFNHLFRGDPLESRSLPGSRSHGLVPA